MGYLPVSIWLSNLPGLSELKHSCFIRHDADQWGSCEQRWTWADENSHESNTDSSTSVKGLQADVDPPSPQEPIRSSIFRRAEQRGSGSRWYLRGRAVQFTVNRFFIPGRSWGELQQNGGLIRVFTQTQAGRDVRERQWPQSDSETSPEDANTVFSLEKCVHLDSKRRGWKTQQLYTFRKNPRKEKHRHFC